MNMKMEEQKAEEIMSQVLRWGILAATMVVLVGAAVFLTHHGMEAPRYKHFNGNQSSYNNFSEIVTQALAFNGLGIIQLGLLLLIFVPTARVAISVFTFALQRDYLYICYSLIVLAVLVYSYVTSAL